MPKKSKTLCVDDLRHAEYYGMQGTFDELYQKSQNGEVFENLMDLILSRDNILLAYRNIKANKGSYTAGTDKKNITDIGSRTPDDVVKRVRFIVTGSKHGYRPKPVRRKDIPKPNGKTRPLGIPCISGISLSIKKGKKYAFVGKSGCGKSTLIKLIAGYYSDFKGNVLYDEDNLSIVDVDKITALSSIIHQNVYMFDESILDNICLHEDYSKEELQSALSDSGLLHFIEQVPNGLEYHVGENGNNLSGGQKQRIAVARALIRKKPLLILDEGTSAIDMQTAYDIESRLLAISDLTLLTITHNMSKDILELYDEIIFMADGRIIEHGTFETLIAKHAAFYDFYQLKK